MYRATNSFTASFTLMLAVLAAIALFSPRPAAAQFQSLYTFTGGADGANPRGSLIQDAQGNLYGTTNGGGSNDAGVVFKLDPSGHETVLHTFTGGADGGFPAASLIQDAQGNLYGTTPGRGNGGYGVVFKLDPSGHETVLYTFTGGADGGSPVAGVIQDAQGNLYGTTPYGGIATGTDGRGVVFKLDPSGHETVLYTFTGGADGIWPVGGVIQDAQGNLYGTAVEGGTAGHGVVFKVDPTGHETTVYNFVGGADGGYPLGGLFQDAQGNLYGTTLYGGTGSSNFPDGAGVVYKVYPSGQEIVLHTFTGEADGGYPQAGVIQDARGNLYGTTYVDDNSGFGEVFETNGLGALTIQGKFKKNTYQAFTLKHGKRAKISILLDHTTTSDQVITMTSSNPSDLANFSVTVPAGTDRVNNAKTPKVNKKAKGHTVTLTATGASDTGSITTTIK